MTLRAILKQGCRTRRERGPIAKLAYLNARSAQKFNDLSWFSVARLLALKTAHRRTRRRAGLALRSVL